MDAEVVVELPEIRKILCPTDFSPFSRRALDHALALARAFGAEIEVLHVFPVAAPVPGDLTFTATFVRLDEDTRKTLSEELYRFIEQAAPAGIGTKALIGEGDPADAILERAKHFPIDVIVMGTHGLRGLDRWITGSVTQKLLRHAPCPVMTVPPGSDASRDGDSPVLGQILCPVDLTEHSATTLEYAVSVARAANAGLTVLHVMEGALQKEDPAESTEGTLPFLLELRRQAEQRSRGVSESLEPGDIEDVHGIERIVIEGRAREEIPRIADERRTDLIVMGVHGRKGIGLTLFGSTAQHVVQHAKCPVLMVRPR